MPKIQRAILSLTDKSGAVEFAGGLAELGVELISTGGTARQLREAGRGETWPRSPAFRRCSTAA
jgi:phosphoribosylaminoimidazolecarboxamide formyltransferase/IMP cyclohydrolase